MASEFVDRWDGYEKGETQAFWTALLRDDVFGVPYKRWACVCSTLPGRDGIPLFRLVYDMVLAIALWSLNSRGVFLPLFWVILGMFRERATEVHGEG